MLNYFIEYLQKVGNNIGVVPKKKKPPRRRVAVCNIYPLAEGQSVQEIRKKVQILFPPSQPKSKEGVVQAVGVLVLGNKVLLQQSPYGRVDCTGRL